MVIHVEWASGSIDLDPDRFFPTTLANLRKLARLIRRDHTWDYTNTIAVITYLENRIEEEKDAAEKAKIDANLARHNMVGAKAMLPAKKPRKSSAYMEYVTWKDELKEREAKIREINRSVDGLQKALEVFEELRWA